LSKNDESSEPNFLFTPESPIDKPVEQKPADNDAIKAPNPDAKNENAVKPQPDTKKEEVIKPKHAESENDSAIESKQNDKNNDSPTKNEVVINK
jgi:hypothetical protein